MGNIQRGRSNSNTRKGGVSRTLTRAKGYQYIVYVANWWDEDGILHREKFSCGNELRVTPAVEKKIKQAVIGFRCKFEEALDSGVTFYGGAEALRVKHKIKELLENGGRSKIVHTGERVKRKAVAGDSRRIRIRGANRSRARA